MIRLITCFDRRPVSGWFRPWPPETRMKPNLFADTTAGDDKK